MPPVLQRAGRHSKRRLVFWASGYLRSSSRKPEVVASGFHFFIHQVTVTNFIYKHTKSDPILRYVPEVKQGDIDANKKRHAN